MIVNCPRNIWSTSAVERCRGCDGSGATLNCGGLSRSRKRAVPKQKKAVTIKPAVIIDHLQAALIASLSHNLNLRACELNAIMREVMRLVIPREFGD